MHDFADDSDGKDIRVMKKTLFFLCLLTIASATASEKWSPESYAQYTFASFQSYAPALERIDMKNIDYKLLHAAVFYETNRIRQQYGSPLLKHADALERAAKSHSDDMVQHQFFSHTSPVKGKIKITDRLAAVGIRNCTMAENIAETGGIDSEPGRSMYTPEQNGGYFSYIYHGEPLPNHTYLSLAKAVVAQWLESKGHRENMLNSQFTYLGVGAAHFNDHKFHNIDKFKITQDFSDSDGQPADKQR
jgi:uncharacterized protein YkwD